MASTKYTTDGSTWGTLASAAQGDQGPMGPMSASRNRIINGDFSVNQREFTSYTIVGYLFYTIDQWMGNANVGTSVMSVQPVAAGDLPDSATRCLRISSSGQVDAGGWAKAIQRIEDVRTLSDKTVTVSFWAKSSVNGHKVGVEMVQNFGTSGSADVNRAFGAVTLSTSWTRVSVTGTLPSLAGKTMGSTISSLQLHLWTTAGSTYATRSSSIGLQNSDIDFWGVQVEEGPFMTSYAKRSFDDELRMCQRYFQKWKQPVLRGTAGSANTLSRMAMVIPVTMAKAPSVSSGQWIPVLSSSGQISTINAFTSNWTSTTVFEVNATCNESVFAAGQAIVTYQSGGNAVDLVAEI